MKIGSNTYICNIVLEIDFWDKHSLCYICKHSKPHYYNKFTCKDPPICKKHKCVPFRSIKKKLERIKTIAAL